MNAESGDRARFVIVEAACVGCMWCHVCWCAELGGRYCVVVLLVATRLLLQVSLAQTNQLPAVHAA